MKIVKDICKILGIGVPNIERKAESEVALFKESPTCLSCVHIEITDSGEEVVKGIYLRDTKIDDVTLAFSLAHELRHIWQHTNGLMDIKNYVERNKTDCVGSYNAQYMEVDANAFAMAYMLAIYRVDIKLNLPGQILAETQNRKEELIKKYWHG